MAARDGKYCIVDLRDNWTGTSVKDKKVAMAMDTEATWGEIALHLPHKDKVTSLVDSAIVLPLTKAPVTSPSKARYAHHCPPTQQEVDAYVNSLEFEVSQEGVHMRQRRVEQRAQPALTAVRRSNSSGLFWCVVAATLACVWWLSLVFN